MKRLISITGLLIAAVVAIAATTPTTTTRSAETHPPTKASLMNAVRGGCAVLAEQAGLRRERPASHTADDRLAHERIRGGSAVLAESKPHSLRPTD